MPVVPALKGQNYTKNIERGKNRMQIVKDDNNRLLNMDEASHLLGIKKSTLYDMVMRKRIAHVKVGRLTKFTLNDIQAYIDKNKVEPIRADINL